MSPEQRSAQRTLTYYSLSLLIFALISPFAGLYLIRAILASVGAYEGGPYVTYFHAALFVLFGGVRPLNHLASLIAGGTRELQGRVHHPFSPTAIADEEADELREKVDRIEDLVSLLTEKLHRAEHAKAEREVRKEKGMLDVQDTFEKIAARLEDGARRREKRAEMEMEMMGRRLDGLEKTCEALAGIVRDMEKERQQQALLIVDGSSGPDARRTPGLRGLILALFDWAESIWLTITFRRPRGNHPRTRASFVRAHGYRPGYGSTPRTRNDATTNGNGASPSATRNNNSNNNGASLAAAPVSGLTSLSRRRSYDAPLLNLDTVLEEEAPGADVDMDMMGEPATGDIPIGDTAPDSSPSPAVGMRRRGGGGRIAPSSQDARSAPA